MELIKGVQYFTKNIVITLVPIEYNTSKKKAYTAEHIALNKSGKGKDWKQSSGKYGNNNIIISSGKQTKSSGSSGEKKLWEMGVNYGLNGFTDDSFLNALDGFDDNTKFFHKEITILPVYIPPPKHSQK